MTEQNTTLRSLVDLREHAIQKNRIAFKNRIDAIEREDDQAGEDEISLLARWYERFVQLEQEADEDIRNEASKYEIIDHMIKVKGVGQLVAARLVCMIDIERANTVSALWRYCGYAVIDGKRERPVKGQLLHYNARLKKACYVMAGQLLKANSPYRQIYDNARTYYDANRDWTKGHKHNAALRKMIKCFLAHLWVRWRTLEGLPVTELYVLEKMGHHRYFEPEDFGWEPVSQITKEIPV